MNNISPILRGSYRLLLFLLLAARAEAFWMLNTVAKLDGTTGKWCEAGVIKGPDGCLYGVAQTGGTNLSPLGVGYGTIFRVETNGGVTPLLNFNGTNGSYASGTLQRGGDGNLYGSTLFGGNGFNGGLNSGFGTLFRISTAGDFTTLLKFDGTNGANPYAQLTLATDGFLYGTTTQSISNSVTGAGGKGTIFRLSTNGEFATLFRFDGTNGASPGGKLLELDGSFYGTTSEGGVSNLGSIFNFSTNGTLATKASFVGTNGSSPLAGLNIGADGQLYGTTVGGGAGYGTVFRFATNGVLAMLHAFTEVDGHFADGLLALGQDGILYGTTANGGRSFSFPGGDHSGTIFQVTTNGVVTSLLSFNNYNGRVPIAGLFADADGSFYGTTSGGGGLDATVFRLSGGESPLIENPEIVVYDDGDRYYRWIRFQWQALAGVSYGVEFNSTLDPQGWSYDPNYGPYLIAVSPTNCVMNSMVDFPSSDPFRMGSEEQRYFRLVLMPP